MDFEFDEHKSDPKKIKHGIDFMQAQPLWDDSRRIEIPARTEDETRWLIIGIIDGRHWSAVITCRGNAIRIISVRRARKEEVDLYEG